MVDVNYEISKEDYEKAKEKGAMSIISDAIICGYGAYGACVYEENGKYYINYMRGSSCD